MFACIFGFFLGLGIGAYNAEELHPCCEDTRILTKQKAGPAAQAIKEHSGPMIKQGYEKAGVLMQQGADAAAPHIQGLKEKAAPHVQGMQEKVNEMLGRQS
eukprot:gnl/TRDRNA2_/TRDRNA2_150860_c0_seq3.p2 gnl/TRDRNA2_/TRDRNA2_150860_c0~~gnl/TRDRNA2_/TRDRNA2_150860_c0_seq3.p2  ORF type:complete len:101 (-),score=36.76 gnl/TRDRNA2_/TRDRNA2_150860_c0_seq3:192-494(-)